MPDIFYFHPYLGKIPILARYFLLVVCLILREKNCRVRRIFYIFWAWLFASNSHRIGVLLFSFVGDPYKALFVTGILGGGHTQCILTIDIFWFHLPRCQDATSNVFIGWTLRSDMINCTNSTIEPGGLP